MRMFDIETNMTHDYVHLVMIEGDDGELLAFSNDWHRISNHSQQVLYHDHKIVALDLSEMNEFDELQGDLCGHNAIGFDFPVLRKRLGLAIPMVRQWDTLKLSKMYDTNITGGHSLRAWGKRLGKTQKGDYTEHDELLTLGKILYCADDVRLLREIYDYLEKHMTAMGFSDRSIRLEMDTAYWTQLQIENGFNFDKQAAMDLYSKLTVRQYAIEDQLQDTFPPIIHERWSEKTGKRLKDSVETFNPGSRAQIARRLATLGVKWKDKTEKGNVIVNEKTLKKWNHIPEAALCLEYLKVGKLSSMVNGWLKHYNEDTGCIHGKVDTHGAVTSRMTHASPNVAQVDKNPESRACWTAPPGGFLVGADASGLELRMLAHYLQDEEYTRILLESDIHWHNCVSAGLYDDVPYDADNPAHEQARDQAKTFIYALIYGAGLRKLGSIVGGGQVRGNELKENFINEVPAYEVLCDKVERIAKQGHLPALDGRRLRVRHAHAALNTLLQGGGAIVMKTALCLAMPRLQALDPAIKLVAQVHDEFQVAVPAHGAGYANDVGRILVQSIRDAGPALDMRLPLDGKYDIGQTWAETH